MKSTLYQIADELRALASVGLRYTENGYDRERYEQALRLSARLAAALENTAAEEILAQYNGGLPHLSPFLTVEIAVFRDQKILLIQRRDDGTWAMPGGLAEVGESLAEAAARELWEEAGLRGRAIQLLGLFDSRRWPARTRSQICIAQFLFEAEGEPSLHAQEGGPSPHNETLATGFFAEDALPPLHVGYDRRIPMAFRLMRGELPVPYFDPAGD